MADRVSIDPELCIGSGECVRLVPGAFVIDESRGVSVPQPAAELADPERLDAAEANCPTRAFRVLRRTAADGSARR